MVIPAVAPFMGAWIETVLQFINQQTPYVAPFMGAWIETSHAAHAFLAALCRALHGRVD